MNTFDVVSNHGRGWRIAGAPECPSFDFRTDAQRYADLRGAGENHLDAWRQVETERKQPTKSPLTSIAALIHSVRHGNACRYVRKEEREAAEQALSAIQTVLATVESEADFNEDGTVTLPLWAFDRLRALRESAE